MSKEMVQIGNQLKDVSKLEVRELDGVGKVWVIRGIGANKGKDVLFNKIGRVCSKCGNFIEWSNFTKSVSIGNKTPSCRECMKRHREDRKDYTRKYGKQYRNDVNNITQATQYNKQYRIDNRDDIKQYRIDNRDRYLEYGKRIRNSPAKYNESRLPLGYTCKSETETGLLLVSCKKCGKFTHVTNVSLNKNIDSQKGTIHGNCHIYCSDGCKNSCELFNNKSTNKAVAYFLKGEALPTSPQSNRPQISPELNKTVLARDVHTCQKCGSTEQLEVHHIIGASRCNEWANDPSNCITLCHHCHREIVHKMDGCTTADYRVGAE